MKKIKLSSTYATMNLFMTWFFHLDRSYCRMERFAVIEWYLDKNFANSFCNVIFFNRNSDTVWFLLPMFRFLPPSTHFILPFFFFFFLFSVSHSERDQLPSWPWKNNEKWKEETRSKKDGHPKKEGPTPTRRANTNPEKEGVTPIQEKEGPTPNSKDQPKDEPQGPTVRTNPKDQPQGPTHVFFPPPSDINLMTMMIIIVFVNNYWNTYL